MPNKSGEGTAMLEIIHDMAPGSELYFATSGSSLFEMAASIDALVLEGPFLSFFFFFSSFFFFIFSLSF